jgi:hypothetical protein
MLQKFSSDTKFLAITSFIVLALGARTFFSLVEPEEIPAAALASKGAAIVGTRTPASVSPQTLEVKPKWERFAHHDLNCSKKGPASVVAVNGSMIQIQGRNCIKGFKTSELEIVNQKNGFTAAIFESGKNEYQTDLIQLEQGDNEITIRYRERSGTVVEEVVKVRATRI